jgi:hypothetical protein
MHSETAVCTQHPAKLTPEPSTGSDYSESCRSGISLGIPLGGSAEGESRGSPARDPVRALGVG